MSYQEEDLEWRNKFPSILQQPNIHFFETPIMERKVLQKKTELQTKAFLKELIDQTIVHIVLLGNNSFKGGIVTQEIGISLHFNRPLGIVRIPNTTGVLPTKFEDKEILIIKWQTEAIQKLLKQLFNRHYKNSFYTREVFRD